MNRGGIIIGLSSFSVGEGNPPANVVFDALQENVELELANSDLTELDEHDHPVEPKLIRFYLDAAESLAGGIRLIFPSGAEVVAEIYDWGFVPIEGSTLEKCEKRYKVRYRQV